MGVRGNDVDVRVRVDDEEVEPAVRVVVQPAEPAAHHRRRVQGHPVPERTLAEVEPDLVGDVHERRAAERAARCRCGRRRRCEAALGANDPIAAVLERELDGSPEALRILTAHECRSPAVGRRHERALEVRDDRRRPLVRARASGTSPFARRRTAPRSSETTARASATRATPATFHWRRSPRASGPCAAAPPTPFGDPRGRPGRSSPPSPGRSRRRRSLW